MTVKSLSGARSPLDGAKHGAAETVFMHEVPFTPGYDLRVDPSSDGFAAVNSALGLTLPTTVGAVVRVNAACEGQPGHNPDATNGISALCLGPDWWFLTGTADVMALVQPLRAQHHLSIVDVSAQRTKLEIYGPESRNVLEHVWEQDIREDSFPVDACSQGLIAKTPVIMWRCCGDCYIVFARSSFARHLWTVLTDATVEYL
ncbi:MAG: sarcosine oxidase subunit gamma family protein [Actinomycetes bacterium]